MKRLDCEFVSFTAREVMDTTCKNFHKPRTTSERLRHLLRCPLCGICEGKLLGNIYTPTQAHPQSALPAPRATKTRWKGVNDVEEHRGLDDARFYPRWLSSFNFPYINYPTDRGSPHSVLMATNGTMEQVFFQAPIKMLPDEVPSLLYNDGGPRSGGYLINGAL
ncbi:hypothetical protein K443DRAFT_582756 [Laccaria amethystina LaAM-08-1]|uniref:Uncharacterized protein n=1 Tax=Laccaria amethystina LaAM-08-1 TaxID=1095629 RepID=A0A0C9X7L0_9AGAR|nr:hypothetical protein K443DRAFT_582756 [Laccaria amethystina LaAM-08-1]